MRPRSGARAGSAVHSPPIAEFFDGSVDFLVNAEDILWFHAAVVEYSEHAAQQIRSLALFLNGIANDAPDFPEKRLVSPSRV